MKRIIIVLLFLLCTIGCATECDLEGVKLSPPAEVWICHNPDSELHGTVCGAEVDILRGRHQPCHWNKNGANYGRGEIVPEAYCWLLEEKDCSGILSLQWQKDNCHFFGYPQ